MNGKAAASVLAIIIGFPGYCVAAEPQSVSHEQAAKEALANRKLANVLWDETHQACANRDWPKQSSIMKTINAQFAAQPVNHRQYSPRFVYSSCQQMLSDVSFINAACFNKPPTQHEIDHINKTWNEDTQLCDAEISSPDLSRAKQPKEQTEAEWEAEQRRDGKSEEDIAFMKQIRSS